MVMVKRPDCDVAKVTEIVKDHVPDGVLESNVSAELSFALPHEESHRFEGLFEYLEDNKNSLGILSYGASVTTMEEVFLKWVIQLYTGSYNRNICVSFLPFLYPCSFHVLEARQRLY